MKSLFKVIALTGCLALVSGGWQPCRADTEAVSTPSTAAGQNYVGRITRTGTNGKKTVGDIFLSVLPGNGFVTANVITDGKKRVYYGRIMPVARDTKASPELGKKRTGVLSHLRKSRLPTPVGGLNNGGFEVALLNVTFTKKQAFGGATTPNGSTLEFTASRLSTAFGNQLPVGSITLPVTPAGSITPIGDGG